MSDIACPWCFVGKRHLEKALESIEDYEVLVNWKPFQLDPTIPETGIERDAYLKHKFGSLEQVQGMLDRLESVGSNAGIRFDWMKRVPNTLRLHNLLHEATKENFGNDLKEAFFKAYFEDVVDLTKKEEIFKILTQFGWSSEKTQEVMEDQAISDLVIQDIKIAQSRGVNGVPFFIINNKYGVSGAQPPERLAEWINSVGAEIKAEDTSSCSVDDPTC